MDTSQLLGDDKSLMCANASWLNVAWLCASLNGYATILFCIVGYKMFYLFFSRQQYNSVNLLVVSIYTLILVDLIVGSLMITSTALRKDIYLDSQRNDFSNFTIQVLKIQKVLYSTLVLTQLFEWLMYINYIKF